MWTLKIWGVHRVVLSYFLFAWIYWGIRLADLDSELQGTTVELPNPANKLDAVWVLDALEAHAPHCLQHTAFVS